MPKKAKPAKRKPAKKPAPGQLDILRKRVRELAVKLEREARARKLEARIKSEVQKAHAELRSQLKMLQVRGRKIATELRSALGDANKREAARKEALKRIEALRAEYSKKSAALRAEYTKRTSELKSDLSRTAAELSRKSDELRKLAAESAHRAVEIIRGPEHQAPPTSPKTGALDPSALRAEIARGDVENPEDDREPDEEQ
ncbi:MAG TPA: hypothetical protein VEU51_06815 [Candidatus Acidoferrales bacterium]|nr:hypothetical protein [Candidatus Acidoferrales bacterium]